MQTNYKYIMVLWLFLSGCLHQYPVITDSKANLKLADLMAQGHSLQSFNGIGKAELIRHNQVQFKQRIAWIGSFPDQLRIEALGAWGLPAAAIAYNGEFMYYRTMDYFLKKRKGSLEKWLGLPVSFQDLTHLLAGRPPPRKYSAVTLSHEVLTLKTRWGRILEKIYLDHSGQIKKVEIFKGSQLAYQAVFQEQKIVGDKSMLPFKISLTDHRGTSFHLKVHQWGLNVPAGIEKFTLKIKSKTNAKE